MTTAAEIWEVMSEEISSHHRDPLEAFRGTGRPFIAYGSTGAKEALEAAERDVGNASDASAEAVLTAACAHYDVTRREIHNSKVRYTAVAAARVSIATTLAARKWTNTAIAGVLRITASSVSHMLHGGRGKGVFASSRICKELVARRPRPPRPTRRVPSGLKKGAAVRLENAAHTLRHLRAVSEEHLMQRVLERYFPELKLHDVYEAAFGPSPMPLTLDEARAAEARGEGTLRFVGGVPTWLPMPAHLLAPQQEPADVRAVAPEIP